MVSEGESLATEMTEGVPVLVMTRSKERAQREWLREGEEQVTEGEELKEKDAKSYMNHLK